MTGLAEVHEWFADQIRQLRILAHETLGVDKISASVLVPVEVQQALRQQLVPENIRTVRFSTFIEDMKALRRHGPKSYEFFPIDFESFLSSVPNMLGRAFLSTKADVHAGVVAERPDENVCVFELDASGQGLTILYGAAEHGNVPTRGFPGYIIGHALGSAALLHAHPESINTLLRYPDIYCCETFNAAVQEQMPQSVMQTPGLLVDGYSEVGILPVMIPGSKEFLKELRTALPKSGVVLLESHGALFKGDSLEECGRTQERLEKAARDAVANFNSGRVLKTPPLEAIAPLIFLRCGKNPEEFDPERMDEEIASCEKQLDRPLRGLRQIIRANGEASRLFSKAKTGVTGHASEVNTGIVGQQIRTSITTFEGSPYEVVRPIEVVIYPAPDDGGYIASAFEAGVYFQGDDPHDAFDNLKDYILQFFEDLTNTPTERLGDEMQNRRRLLEGYIQKNDPSRAHGHQKTGCQGSPSNTPKP